MNKPTQQQVIEAYKRLPPPVQEFLADPDQLARVLTDIRNAHSLHIDVVGQVSESIGHLLLGLASPIEFRDTLKTAGVSEVTANDIIGEINQKIFVPLREQMRKGSSAAASAPSRPPVQQTAQMAGNEPLPLRPAVAPSVGGPQSEKHFQLQNKIPPRPLNNPPSGLSGDRSVKQNDLAAAPSQRPDLRNVLAAVTKSPNLLNGEKLLEDHEEPHIEFRKSVPPPNLPGAPRPSEAFGEGGIPPPVSAPLKPSTLPIASVPPVPAKPYSSDPYREPVDEK